VCITGGLSLGEGSTAVQEEFTQRSDLELRPKDEQELNRPKDGVCVGRASAS
jgi:hypothetical protein